MKYAQQKKDASHIVLKREEAVMSKMPIAEKETWSPARKALACIASIILTVGLAPGIALADDSTYVINEDQHGQVYVPYNSYDNVKVEGDIDVKNDTKPFALHINAVEASGNVDEKAEVTGSVSKERDAFAVYAVGVDASTTDCNTGEVVVGGDVTAKSTYSGNDGGEVQGVHIQTGGITGYSGKAIVTVNGEIGVSAERNSEDGKISTYGVNVYNFNDQASVYAGNVTVDNKTEGKAVGIEVRSYDSESTTTILVDKTVSATSAENGNSAGIAVGPHTKGILDITVWRIVVEEDGYIAASSDGLGGFVENTDLEKKINYIIKYDQPTQGDILSLSGTTKKDITIGDNAYSLDVANWTDGDGNKVYLKAAEGWVITGGFSDKEKTVPLLYDDDGWYAMVPNGGGVYLSAQVALQQFDVVFKNGEEVLQSDKVEYGGMPEYRGAKPAKAPTVAVTYEFAGWKPVLDKVTGDITYEATFIEKPREYTVTFDLGGGTIDGESSYTMTALYGSTIKLPTPVREGYEFLYWEGSHYDAGASYKVEGEHSFTAVWKENGVSPVTPDEPTSTESASTISATGDSTPIAPIVAMMLLSVTMLAFSRKKLG